MSFSRSSLNGVKVYNLTFGKTDEQWMNEQRMGNINSLKYNEQYRRRVEFIQDGTFPTGSTQVLLSYDGMYLMATGIYPPTFKMFELSELSMKFERGLESESIQAIFLSNNWEKLAILRDHRWIEFHTKHGRHYNLRIPYIGTNIGYNKPLCELYIGTIKNKVLRMNLEIGKYFSSYELNSINYISCQDNNKIHLLNAFGGLNGKISFIDPRNKNEVKIFDLNDSNKKYSSEVTKLKFDNDGLTFGVGLSNGIVNVYDLRRKNELYSVNHKNNIPINDIHFHNNSNKIISSDAKTVRYWNRLNGSLYTVITSKDYINNIASDNNSGILFMSQNSHKIGAYYLPSIGIAPKWCPFLDSMTEELEEVKFKSIYVNYKFITRDELELMGLEHLIGTSLLKAYMHGFFIDLRLYRRIKSIVNPDKYKLFIDNKINKKINDKTEHRILTNKSNRNNIKFNREYANYLLTKSKDNNSINKNNALIDPRFNQMFKSKDYEINFKNDKYLNIHNEIKYALNHVTKNDNNSDNIYRMNIDDNELKINDNNDTFDDILLNKYATKKKIIPSHQIKKLPSLMSKDESDNDIEL